VDDIQLLLVVFFLKVIGVQAVKKKPKCCVFVLCGVVRHVGDDGVHDSVCMCMPLCQ